MERECNGRFSAQDDEEGYINRISRRRLPCESRISRHPRTSPLPGTLPAMKYPTTGDSLDAYPTVRCLVLVALQTAASLFALPAFAADDVTASPRALSQAFRRAARIATPSVVTVIARGQQGGVQEQEEQEGFEDPSPLEPMPGDRPGTDGQRVPATGLGSGVILTADGVVVTNNHVVAGAQRVDVRLQDGRELTAVEVHGDPDSDLATLRIDPVAANVQLQPATIGDSDMMEIGDWVLAIGSPFRLEATVSAGIISAKDRSLIRIRRGRLLQTDAAINPGNSGGALVDLDGRVVGINTAIATRNGSYQGIGFAIPITQARWVADELIAHGRVRRAALGIRLAELNANVAAKLQLPVGLGVLVYQIIDNSAADQAGIEALDVILEFAGTRVRKPSELQEVVERLPVGSTQTVKVQRGGEPLELRVTLAPLDDPTAVPNQTEAARSIAEESAEKDPEETSTDEDASPAADDQKPAADKGAEGAAGAPE